MRLAESMIADNVIIPIVNPDLLASRFDITGTYSAVATSICSCSVEPDRQQLK